MDEAERKFRRRAKHVKQATDVNRRHADMLKSQSESRHQRSRIQVRAEVQDNRVIDYRKHMKWLEE